MDEPRHGRQTPGRRDGGRRVRLRNVRTFGLAVAAVLGLVWAGLNRYGFPDGVTRSVAARLSRGDYAVELDRVTLDLTGGLVARSVRVYRKGVVGQPPFEAGSVRLGLAPFFWRWGKQAWIRDIEVADGVIRRLPDLAKPPERAETPGVAAGFILPFAAGSARLRNVEVFDVFVAALRSEGFPVETGFFQEEMEVELVNDGPVTFIL